MEILFSVAAIVIVVALVLSPFMRVVEERGANDDLAALETAKQAKYREIRDAELDYRSGKLTEAEWRETDDELRREAMTILGQLDGPTMTN